MKPKLRDLDVRPIQHQGQPWIALRDPLGLSSKPVVVARPLAPLLGLMDGSREEGELEAAFRIRAGMRLPDGLLGQLLAELDEACLLDNERFALARTAALEAYRQAPFRPMTVGDDSFANDPLRAGAHLKAYIDALPPLPAAGAAGTVRGLVSPHIDYQRGGPVYAEVWRAASQAARRAELVILLGTDHHGSSGSLTLTRQSYTTPWGALPTDARLVDTLAGVLGDAAFAEELHHRGEHSVELAAVWLHFAREGQPIALLPILCGGFEEFLAGEADPATYEPFCAAVDVLRQAIAEREALVVAAADLAHVGPAFGDAYGVDFIARARLRNADERLLACVYAGDAAGFFAELKAEQNRRHVCGLPPIYLMLRLLGAAQGEAAGYDLCPADTQGTSVVSIAGVVLY